nr:probable aquaporin SIP2-1 [Tanacetum cinerariifolium]
MMLTVFSEGNGNSLWLICVRIGKCFQMPAFQVLLNISSKSSIQESWANNVRWHQVFQAVRTRLDKKDLHSKTLIEYDVRVPSTFCVFRKTWISSLSKLTLHILGSDLTGGCINPASLIRLFLWYPKMEEVKRIKVIHTSQLEAVPELIHHIQSLLPVKEAART